MYWYIIPYVYTHTWITPDYTALSLEEWLSDGSVYPNTCWISWYPSHSACEAGLYGTCVVHSRMLQLLQSCLTFRDPMDLAHQPPLSMGFSRQEYWSGLPCPPPGDLPNPGKTLGLQTQVWRDLKPRSLPSPALQVDSLPLSHQGSPMAHIFL